MTNAAMREQYPLISVILNNYNYDRYLADAIDSALDQQYPNIEVIVVDDGSTDGSRKVIRSYGAKILPIFQANGGQAAAINSGYRASSGDIVIFLDSDDLLEADICAKIAKLFLADDQVAKVQYRLKVVDSAGEPTGGLLPPSRMELPQGDITALVERQRSYTHPPTSGNAFRRKYIDELFPIPEEIYKKGAAAYLVYNSVLLGTISSISDVGGSYRIHGMNITGSNPYLDGARLQAHLYEEICERHKQIEIIKNKVGKNIPLIGMADFTHIKSRIILKKLHPAYYTYKEGIAFLCFRGCISTMLYESMENKDRIIWFAWFIMISISPRAIAKILVEKATDQSKRRGLLRMLVGNRDRRKQA